MAELDVERFFKRLGKLHSQFVKHNAAVWNNADCLVLCRGKHDESEQYIKSSLLHLWIFGYEVPDTILVLTKDGSLSFLGTKKKTDFLSPAVNKIPSKSTIKSIELLVRNKEDNNAANFKNLWEQAGIVDGSKRKIGVFMKDHGSNTTGCPCVSAFEDMLSEATETVELVDISSGLSFCMSVKDDTELDLMRKSSVLSNKIMKHGFIAKMEAVVDKDQVITHEQLAQHLEDILEDPSKIKLQVPKDDVASCYYPSIHSGGDYDVRVSAGSDDKQLSHDVITVSFGARYKNYCSNIARTYLVDPPKNLSDIYEVLLELQETCIEAMRPGNELKQVYKDAVKFLQEKPKFEYLVNHLPKNLGYCTGLDFRETPLLLSPKNMATFKKGMVFCLNLAFQDVPLSEEDRTAISEKSSTKKLEKFSLLLADMIAVTADTPDLLTKLGKNLTDVAYNINDQEDSDASSDEDDDEDEDASDDDAPKAPKGDRQLAKKLAKEGEATGRKSSRLAKEQAKTEAVSEGAAQRLLKQIKLMKRRNEERLRELARANRNKDEEDGKSAVDELEAYKRTRDYPDNVQPNQVKVDMANQCVLLPICGNAVPFHISTIKNVVMPDADNVTLLRINFYTAGIALGKDAPANMVKLVQKYAPYASFVREMTFRSLDGHNLTLAFRQISELRKRERQKEITLQEEANLVKQEKLVRTKNERVPRLADLTMRPVFAGRKTQGNLEAHSNGLRFISSRNEIVDIMYANIKYAIFQPCENEIMVLVHFHLKNPIMIGKKRQNDVQFFTEVVDASQAVDNSRRSMYDPDEMDDEQRERQLRKRLNQAFKEFCKKVDAVAKKNGYNLEFEIPYRDLGFTGNPHKEMVKIMPTLSCLVNLTETPFFVVDLEQVDHVHFERVTYMSKAFDMVLVNKDFKKPAWRVDMIPNEDKDAIQEWLTDMELTFTEGPMNLNWKQIMATILEDDRFYMDTEDDEVTKKPAGWEFLRMYGDDDEEEEEDPDADDSEFDEEKIESEESEASDSEEDFDSEDDEDDFDEDAEDELEEQGLDWDEMEVKAAAEDKRKRVLDEDMDNDRPLQRASKKNRRR